LVADRDREIEWYDRTILCDPGWVSRSTSSLADYRAALTAPGALLPALASALARLPMAMIGLATLLYVQRVSGSFATAGLVSAGALIGVSCGSIVQGRVIDRIGPTRPLLVAAALLAAAGAALVGAVEARAPLPVLVAAAVGVGLAQPAMPGASRALWARLVPAGPVATPPTATKRSASRCSSSSGPRSLRCS